MSKVVASAWGFVGAVLSAQAIVVSPDYDIGSHTRHYSYNGNKHWENSECTIYYLFWFEKLIRRSLGSKIVSKTKSEGNIFSPPECLYLLNNTPVFVSALCLTADISALY